MLGTRVSVTGGTHEVLGCSTWECIGNNIRRSSRARRVGRQEGRSAFAPLAVTKKEIRKNLQLADPEELVLATGDDAHVTLAALAKYAVDFLHLQDIFETFKESVLGPSQLMKYWCVGLLRWMT